jgi:hypothetical protein
LLKNKTAGTFFPLRLQMKMDLPSVRKKFHHKSRRRCFSRTRRTFFSPGGRWRGRHFWKVASVAVGESRGQIPLTKHFEMLPAKNDVSI